MFALEGRRRRAPIIHLVYFYSREYIQSLGRWMSEPKKSVVRADKSKEVRLIYILARLREET